MRCLLGGNGRAGAAGVVIVLAACGSMAHASAFNVDWLDTSAVAHLDNIASGSVFNLPGYGNVQLDYTLQAGPLNNVHNVSAAAQNGTLVAGPDTYSWGAIGAFSRVNFNPTGSSDSYSVTYTFLNGAMPAGELALAVSGLGRVDLVVPGSITTATVNQNGTFLGDYNVGSFGPTEFTGGAGSFVMRNSLPGDLTPGNPSFNSQLGIVRIDDGVTSLTINMSQIGQDGIGMTVGRISIPAPGAAGLLGIFAAAAMRRRRN